MADPSNPRLTWIMIFLNGERFLDAAIRSVVGQVGYQDWELVLVDDGSTDQSTAIARRWADDDPTRIRYVDHPGHQNLGMSASRNRGIEEARGELIGFLDSDDILLPDTMRRSAEMFDKHPTAEALIGRSVIWFSWARPHRINRDVCVQRPGGLEPGVVLPPPELFRSAHANPAGWWGPGICSVVLRRDAIDRIGGFESSFRGLFEDQVMYAKVSLLLSTVLDDQLFALYRQHRWSACARDGQPEHPLFPRRDRGRERFLKWLTDLVVAECGVDSQEAALVRAHTDLREPVQVRLERLWWRIRYQSLNRMHPRAAAALRRLRAGPFRTPSPTVRRDPLSPEDRELIAACVDNR